MWWKLVATWFGIIVYTATFLLIVANYSSDNSRFGRKCATPSQRILAGLKKRPTISRGQFNKKIFLHEKWLFTSGAAGERLNLSGYNLTDLSASWKNLSYALLDDVVLQHSNLQGTNFMGASLVGSDFYCSNLRKAILEETKVNGTEFGKAKLYGTYFDIEISGLPDIPKIAYARGLEELDYNLGPAGLSALRAAFARSGLKQQASQVTYAIKRNDRIKNFNIIEGGVNYALF